MLRPLEWLPIHINVSQGVIDMNRKIISTALVSLLIAACSGMASADRCKDVAIKVKNDFTHDGEAIQIKAVDFDYWDDTEGKWREENWVGNEVIDPGDLRTINTRNLEYVGGESGVVLRVQYKYMTATKGWSEKLNAQSSSFFCKKDGPNPVTVTVLPN
jgi:hypothetical protein